METAQIIEWLESEQQINKNLFDQTFNNLSGNEFHLELLLKINYSQLLQR